MSFTQSELDEVLNTMFTPEGTNQLWYRSADAQWCVVHGPVDSINIFSAKTPAKAIRAATAALVAARLTK